jgi:hypothetical protein
MVTKNSSLCPVCGYNLPFPAWQGDSASDEYCPCCGIQFGFHDFAKGDLEERQKVWDEWRRRWIAGGMKWSGTWTGKFGKPPENWNPKQQLKDAGLTS